MTTPKEGDNFFHRFLGYFMAWDALAGSRNSGLQIVRKVGRLVVDEDERLFRTLTSAQFSEMLEQLNRLYYGSLGGSSGRVINCHNRFQLVVGTAWPGVYAALKLHTSDGNGAVAQCSHCSVVWPCLTARLAGLTMDSPV